MYNRQHLHFVGIGGVGMAGIAEVLLNLGYTVSGSDLKRSALTDHLVSLGATVVFGHAPENVPQDTSVIVISSAVNMLNPELVIASERRIPIIPRAEMLGELMRMKYGIAVAGSHGKTTTTSMTAKILRDTGLDPTVIIGGRVLSQQSGASLGMGDYLVAEADESDGSFCLLSPAIAVVTNIDREHMGHYGSFGALEAAFAEFMSKVPFYGIVIACCDDPIVARVAKGLKRRVLPYGFSPENYISAKDIEPCGATTNFTLMVDGKESGRCELPMLGSHMVSNSLAAIAVGLELGVYPEEACRALESFSGVARRAELVWRGKEVMILDDYGHHPREILATLLAMKRAWVGYKRESRSNDQSLGRLIVVFQPHRYSRTQELFSEFLTSFGDADELLLMDIYSAGEQPISGISGEGLAAAVQHPNVVFTPTLEDVQAALLERARPGDVIVTMGAGNVWQVGKQIAPMLEKMGL